MREFWRTLSFGFGTAAAAASLLRLWGIVEITPSDNSRLLLLIFAVCAAVSGAGVLLRSARLPDWFRGFLLAATGFFLGNWALQAGLALASAPRALAFSAVLTACSFAGTLMLNRLTAGALAVEINDELKAMHDQKPPPER